MNAATVTQGLICHVFNKLYHQRSTRVRLNCCWIRRKQTKLESHRGKKKNKKNNRGSIDSFTEICLLHQSCSDPGEVSEGITGSHAWRSSPARHVSSPTLIVTSTSSPSTNAPSHRETYKHTVHHLSRQQSDMMGNETQRTQTNPGFVVIARKKNHTCLCVNVFRCIHF